MKIRLFIKRSLCALSLSFIFVSCSLDVVPDGVASIDKVFESRTTTERYMSTCYSYVPLYGAQTLNPGIGAGGEFWFYTFKDNNFGNDQSFYIANGFQNANDPRNNYWDGGAGGVNMMQAIRDCNIFIENVSDLNKVKDLSPTDRKRWLAEVKALKGYFHFYLLNLYGPIPIIDKNLPTTAAGAELRVSRQKVDVVVDYIVGLFDESLEGGALPTYISNEASEMGRLTRPAVMGLKTKVLLLAASPLFNGNTDYANFKDHDGLPFVNQVADRQKWVLAAQAAKEAIDEAEIASHRLYVFSRDDHSEIDQIAIPMNVRAAVTKRFNSELVWGVGKGHTWDLQTLAQPRLVSAHAQLEYATKSLLAPPLEIAELFYSSNGVPINEDKDWEASGWYTDRYSTSVAQTADKYYIKSGYTTAKLHFKREARFYGALGFDGSSWYGQGKEKPEDLYYLEAKQGQIAGRGLPGLYSITGYFSKKLVNYKNILSNPGTVINEYPFPIIRLADLYLMYAEALNESVDSGSVPADVYTYLDLIRERSGLNGVVDSWANFSNNPTKPLTKDGMRDIIHQERGIELALETHRYDDMRRWKKAMTAYNTTISGWSVDESATAEYYVVREIKRRIFSKKDYLWPIKESNLLINSNLIQNPGW